MIEQRCPYPHPDFPNQQCKAKIKAFATAGIFTVECWRCYQPVTFNFETAGTEAVVESRVLV